MLRFQTRVLILVMVVAAIATTVTAGMTYHLAETHILATQAADQKVVERISRTLVDHAQQHAAWDGVPAVVAELAKATGKRIEVRTESGTLLAGTGRSAGDAQVTRVDPHPRLVFSDGDAEPAVTHMELDTFRADVRLAACLTKGGVPVRLVRGPRGVPHLVGSRTVPPGAGEQAQGCRTAAGSTDTERNQDFAAVNACAIEDGKGSITSCLQAAFSNRVRDVGPEPVSVAIGSHAPELPIGPVVGVIAFVMACAAVGSVVVSRRALRPINALTRAARQLGRGAGWEQLQERGNDEVAELTRTFNSMAASLKRGEERQRRMVADVAHELRTPLSTVRSYLEGLIDGVVPAGPELFVSLHDEAMLQQRIVDDLHVLAQAEAGSLSYRKDRLGVAELLEMCRTAVAVKAESAGIRLAVQTSAQAQVYADPDRLRQVVGNLVGNALRYTPAGGSITMSSRVSGEAVIVEVADTGCGIAPDDLPHVFDRFWRADASRGRSTGGSGLGLAIARQIVADHGGDISVRSRLGDGTTFTVRLPLSDVASHDFPAVADAPSVPVER